MRRVLLLEDNDDVRRAMTFLLQAEGYDVAAYASAEAAAKDLNTCFPDLAILDVHLPGRSGDDFGRELRQRCPDAKILFATADADIQRLKTTVPGCFVLSKPLDIDLLTSTLRCL